MKNKLLMIFVFFIIISSSFSLAAVETLLRTYDQNGNPVYFKQNEDGTVAIDGLDSDTNTYADAQGYSTTQTTMQQLSTLISLICMFQSQQDSADKGDDETEQSASFCDGQFMQVMTTMNSLSTAKTKTQASPGDDAIYVCEIEYKGGIETARNCEVIDEDGYDLNYFFENIPSGGASLEVTKGCHINKWKITSEETTKNLVEVIFKDNCQINLKYKDKDYVIKNIKPNQDEPPYKNVFDLTFEKDKNNQLSGRIFFNDKWDKNIGFKVEKTKLEILKDTEETFLINGHKFSKLTKGTIIAYPTDDRLTIEPPPEKDCYELEKTYGEYYEVCGDAEFGYDEIGTLVIGTRTVATIKGTPIGDVTLKPIEKGGVATLSIYDKDNMYLGEGSWLSDSQGNDIFASESEVLIRNECYSKDAQINFINYCYNPNTGKNEINHANGNGFTIAKKQEGCYDSYSFKGGALSFEEVITQEKNGVCNKAVSGYPDSKTVEEFYGICSENSKLNANTYPGEKGIDFICSKKTIQYANIKETSSNGVKCYTRNLARSPASSLFGRIFNVFGFSILDITGKVNLNTPLSCNVAILSATESERPTCRTEQECINKGWRWCYNDCLCLSNEVYERRINAWVLNYGTDATFPKCEGSSITKASESVCASLNNLNQKDNVNCINGYKLIYNSRTNKNEKLNCYYYGYSNGAFKCYYAEFNKEKIRLSDTTCKNCYCCTDSSDLNARFTFD